MINVNFMYFSHLHKPFEKEQYFQSFTALNLSSYDVCKSLEQISYLFFAITLILLQSYTRYMRVKTTFQKHTAALITNSRSGREQIHVNREAIFQRQLNIHILVNTRGFSHLHKQFHYYIYIDENSDIKTCEVMSSKWQNKSFLPSFSLLQRTAIQTMACG